MRRMLVVLALLVLPLSARGVECPVGEGRGAALTHIDAQARLFFLQSHLSKEAPRAQRWFRAWTIGFSGLAAVQLLAPLVVKDRRVDFYVGAGASLVGLAASLIGRPSVISDGPAFVARVAGAPQDADPCVLVAEGERMLVHDAEMETTGRGPVMHILNVGFNVGVGLVLGFVFHRTTTAIVNTLVGTAIGEAQVLTRPRGLVDALKRYDAGLPDPPARPWRWQLAPTLDERSAGLTLLATF
jgi:uncharacterized membrane protein